MSGGGGVRKLKCLICCRPLSHFSLGVRVCRACGSFFRRSLSQRLRYVCQRNNDCSLEYAEQRKMCKACRFERFRHLDIVEFAPATKLGRRSYRKQSSLSTSSLSVDEFCSEPMSNSQIVASEELIHVDALFAYEGFSRACEVEGRFSPLQDLGQQPYASAFAQLVRIQASAYTHFLQLIHQHPLLGRLSSEQRVELLNEAFYSLEALRRALLTTQHVPSAEDQRFALSDEHFFATVDELAAFPCHLHVPPSLINQSAEWSREHGVLSQGWIRRLRLFVRRFKRACVRREDVDALMELELLKHAERLHLLNDAELETARADRLSRWTADLREHYGDIEGIQKMSAFMLLCLDVEHLSTERKHLEIVCQIKWT